MGRQERLLRWIAARLASVLFLALNAAVWPVWYYWGSKEAATFWISYATMLVDVFFLVQGRWQQVSADRNTAGQNTMMRAILALVERSDQPPPWEHLPPERHPNRRKRKPR